jgi:hypothetical protein
MGKQLHVPDTLRSAGACATESDIGLCFSVVRKKGGGASSPQGKVRTTIYWLRFEPCSQIKANYGASNPLLLSST